MLDVETNEILITLYGAVSTSIIYVSIYLTTENNNLITLNVNLHAKLSIKYVFCGTTNVKQLIEVFIHTDIYY